MAVETIDLFQLHGQDYNTPVEETLSTLDQLVRAGKVRYIGCSNFSGWHLMKSLAVSDRYGYARYVAHQAYYSLLNRDYEWELMPLGRDQGVGAVVWSPLGWGKLTGKIRRGQPAQPGTRAHAIPETGPRYDEERLFGIVDALDEVAKETGKTIPQIALNWLLRRPTVASVIIGARNEAQLLENIGAVGWKLTPEQVAKLDAASDVAAGLSGLAPARLSDAQRKGGAELKAARGDASAPPVAGRALPSECVAVVVGLQKLPHPRLGALVEHAARRAFVDDAAFVDESDAAGDMGGEAHFVGDDEHRHAFGREALHHLQDFADQLGIERRGWLIEQHEAGLHRQRPRDGDALLLAAR